MIHSQVIHAAIESVLHTFAARQRRPHYTLFAKFEDPQVPSEPMKEAVEKLNKKLNDPVHVTILEKVSHKSFYT